MSKKIITWADYLSDKKNKEPKKYVLFTIFYIAGLKEENFKYSLTQKNNLLKLWDLMAKNSKYTETQEKRQEKEEEKKGEIFKNFIIQTEGKNKNLVRNVFYSITSNKAKRGVKAKETRGRKRVFDSIDSANRYLIK